MFTDDEVIESMKQAVAQEGADYVYPYLDCNYSMDNRPACIVGHVLHDIDPTAYALAVEWERSFNNSAVDDLQREGFLPDFTDGQVTALLRAQERQDKGATWGAAYDAFILALDGEVA